jgi:hypothetical protein
MQRAGALIICVCFFLALAASAQTITVTGIVRSPGAMPAPGASVVFQNESGAKTFFADEEGHFQGALPPGKYNVKVTLLGFEPQERTVELQASQAETEVEFMLWLAPPPAPPGVPAAAAEAAPAGAFVAVNAEAAGDPRSEAGEAAPAPPQLSAAELGHEATGDAFVISGTIARNLAAPDPEAAKEVEGIKVPKKSKGKEPLANSVAGKKLAAQKQAEAQRKAYRDNLAKALTDRSQPRGAAFAGAAGPPGGSPDLSGFWSGGGPKMNRVRSSVRLRTANSVFDARPFSFSGIAQPRQDYSNESVSITSGGPLEIPRLFKVQRMTWMVNYEENRGRRSQDSTTTVPLAAMRAGDFSSIKNVIYDPLTGQPFDSQRIPAERFNPAAAGLLRFFPDPNLPGSITNYHLQQVLPSATDQFSARWGRSLSQRSRSNVFAAYTLNQAHSEHGQIYPGLLSYHNSRGQNAGAGFTWMINRRTSNDFRVNFNRLRYDLANGFAFVEDVAGPLGIQGVSRDPRDWGLPSIGFSNFGRLADVSPLLRRNNVWRITEDFVQQRRRHTLRFGANLTWALNSTFSAPNARGSFSFTGQATSGYTPQGGTMLGTGFDFADFLLGLPQSTSLRYGQNGNYFKTHFMSYYAQDDMRPTPRLSITLGLRYELLPPPIELRDHIVNLDVAQWFQGVAAVLPGGVGPFTGQFPRALIRTDANNFAPRAGFAWRPSRQRRLTLRGGYGLFYDNTVWERITPQLATQPPFALTTSRLTSLSQVLTLQNPFPPQPQQTVKNTYAADKNFVLPYIQNWNLSLQQDLKHGVLLELGYLGTKGTKLYLIRSPNRAPAGSQLTSEQRRFISDAGGFHYHTSGAGSLFHSFQARLHRRFASGFTVSGVYTFSKSIDNASSIGGVGSIVAQDDSNLRGDRGLSSFDQRHKLEVNWIYDFPFGQRRAFLKEGWGARILGSWQVSGNANFYGGQPYTPLVGGNRANNSGTGGGADRADTTGLAVAAAQPIVNQWFNLAAFSNPQPGHFGNAGRNVIIGPAQTGFNSAITKYFRIGDMGPRGEVRLEANNLFNTPVFSGLGTALNTYNYGRLTAARQMRSLTWHVRVSF